MTGITTTNTLVGHGRGGSSSARRGGLRQAGRPGLVWAVPGLLFFGFFALVPLVYALYLSFCSYNGLAISSPEWVGLANWQQLFGDRQALSSLIITVVLVVLAVVTQAPLSLLIGVWAAGPGRGRAVVVAIYFVPLLMSTAAVTVLWASLLDPNFGLPAILPWLFGDGNLLGNQASAIGVIAFIYLWGATPLHTLIYQGGARQIPQVLYQAAALDGAGRLRQFFNVTIPQLRNTIVTDTILIVVGTFTTFDLILILTGGGPNQGTAILPYYMYEQGFSSYNLGYGSVIAVLLVGMALIVSLLIIRFSGYSRTESTLEGI